MMNKKASSVLGYKGVDERRDQKRRKRFRATINFNGKQIFLGNYLTAEEAARTYDKKAFELYGEYAWLNFPICIVA
jgi:hypothetical protein